MIGKLAFIAFILAGCIFSLATGPAERAGPPQVAWSKAYGGDYYDYGSSLRQTPDNGFIITGGTSPAYKGDRNVLLIKTDENGTVQWQRSYGGDGFDYGYSVINAAGGGYVIAGNTESFGNGSSDAYLLRVDEKGTLLWQKTYGGKGSDEGLAVLQASDGGYVIAGFTQSSGNGHSDIYLVKTDPWGTLEWEKAYGGPYDDLATAIKRDRGGGYILSGYQGVAKDRYRAYLLKVDDRGNRQWDSSFDTVDNSIAYDVTEANDGGYLAVGYTGPGQGVSNVCLFKVGHDGRLQWQKILADNRTQKGYTIHRTPDGGYLAIGMAGVANHGAQGGNRVKYEGLLIKADPGGNIEWQKTYGEERDVFIRTGLPTRDGGLALVGSIGKQGDVETWDVYLLKLS